MGSMTSVCETPSEQDLALSLKECSNPIPSPRTALMQAGVQDNKNAWIKATLESNLVVIEDLAEDFPDTIVETIFPNGDRAIHQAIRNHDIKLLFFLLDLGARVNVPNAHSGDTPLHLACKEQTLDAIGLLLKHGANPGLRNNSGETAEYIAKRKGNRQIMAVLSPAAMFLIDCGLEAAECYNERISRSYNPGVFEPCPIDEESPLDDTELSSSVLMPLRKGRPTPLRTSSTPKPRPSVEEVQEMIMESSAPTQTLFHKMEEIREEEEQVQLTNTRGWLGKRQSKPPYAWQTRWVIVKGSYLLWSNKHLVLGNPSNPRERRRFNHSICFMAICGIEPIVSKSGRKFKVRVRGSRKKNGPRVREYEFKATDEDDQKFWVSRLRVHKSHYDEMLHILETS